MENRPVPLLVFLLVIAVYLPTMFPGVGGNGGGDTPKFQYLGSVLGTPHPPGYPLYIFVSFLFSKLPIGTLAYRMNLLSVVLAAGAASLACASLLRLRAHALVAAAAALGLAFDRYVWSRSLSAEVYSLSAFMAALVVYCAIRWQQSGRDRDLFLTAGVFGLSLGNHLTIAMIAPALALFVIAARPRSVTLRTTVLCLLITAAGLLQYGFIMLRTWQNGPHVEARAETIGQLIGVMRGNKYANQMFIFSGRELLDERLPRLWQLFLDDFGPLGIVALGAGLLAVVIKRMPIGVLLAGGAAAIAALTLNIDADVEGFLLPAFVLAWILGGLGLQTLWPIAARAGRPGIAAATVLVCALPIWQVAANYRVNDHHRRTYETRYLNALFARLDDRTAFVAETYSLDQLILYKIVGDRAGRGRTVMLIPGHLASVQKHAADGYTVYAFAERRAALEGLGMRFEPVQLMEQPDTMGAVPGEPIDMSSMPIFKLTSWSRCTDIGNLGWRELGDIGADGRLVLRIDNYRPFDSVAVVYLGAEAVSAPAQPVISQGPVVPTFAASDFVRNTPGDTVRLQESLRRDQVPATSSLLAASLVRRIELRVNDTGQYSQTTVALGVRHASIGLVRATVDLNNPRRAAVCGWAQGDLLASRTLDQVPLGTTGDAWFGQGWSPAEPDGAGTVRRTLTDGAEIAVPLARAGHVRVQLRVRREGPGADQVVVSVNGQALDARAVGSDWQTHRWDLGSGLAVEGLNRVTIGRRPSQTMRSPDGTGGLAIGELSFELIAAGSAGKESRR